MLDATLPKSEMYDLAKWGLGAAATSIAAWLHARSRRDVHGAKVSATIVLVDEMVPRLAIVEKKLETTGIQTRAQLKALDTKIDSVIRPIDDKLEKLEGRSSQTNDLVHQILGELKGQRRAE